MVTLLYRHHANPNIIDNQGYNALHLAIHVKQIHYKFKHYIYKFKFYIKYII